MNSNLLSHFKGMKSSSVIVNAAPQSLLHSNVKVRN